MTTTDAEPAYGTNEYAEQVAKGRHPGVRDALLWLTFGHLPRTLRVYSEPFFSAGCSAIHAVPVDSPELATALNLLVQAKDAAVRAGIKAQQGRAGSIPRPQGVIDPPRG
jgi:hypothetical protein